MTCVFVPPSLRSLTGGADSAVVAGETVRQLIAELDLIYPGLRERLCDGDGLKPGLTVAVDGRVSTLGLIQKVSPDSEVHFLPAIGGG